MPQGMFYMERHHPWWHLSLRKRNEWKRAGRMPAIRFKSGAGVSPVIDLFVVNAARHVLHGTPPTLVANNVAQASRL
jgi:hypothetical protein